MDKILTVLRCGGTAGSWCYKHCKYRENDRCELSENKTRHDAANLLESLQAEVTRLRNENAMLEKDNQELRRKYEAAVSEILHNCYTCKDRTEKPCSGDPYSKFEHRVNCPSWKWRGEGGAK